MRQTNLILVLIFLLKKILSEVLKALIIANKHFPKQVPRNQN